ncbi:MAG: 16S rRNA (guanine(966)-N(2))-methyltransferase RsmD [Cystobacterineae bacterium]|nr:16S rRNA (guanine(966)-N(2))-methyltransferase RsmD [Cystobacterineae bacterium]
MRVIAGIHRGRHLLGPNSKDIRPTADRVRESIFNVLGQHFDGLQVLDLFAGTGAMALEALSRNAVSALLVDKHLDAVSLCKKNIANLGLEAQSEVWHMDAFAALSRCKTQNRRFELVFADPPYAFQNWGGLWLSLLKEEVLTPEGRVVIERDRRSLLPPLPPALSLQREMKFGDTLVSILLHSPC